MPFSRPGLFEAFGVVESAGSVPDYAGLEILGQRMHDKSQRLYAATQSLEVRHEPGLGCPLRLT